MRVRQQPFGDLELHVYADEMERLAPSHPLVATLTGNGGTSMVKLFVRDKVAPQPGEWAGDQGFLVRRFPKSDQVPVRQYLIYVSTERLAELQQHGWNGTRWCASGARLDLVYSNDLNYIEGTDEPRQHPA